MKKEKIDGCQAKPTARGYGFRFNIIHFMQSRKEIIFFLKKETESLKQMSK